MKKIVNNKLYIILLIPILLFLIKGIVFGVDLGFLLSEGKYVLNNGIPNIDPLTFHNGLSFIMHQWLTSIFFYLIYNYIGKLGLIILELLMILLINIILYKLCKLISNKKELSIIISTIITTVIVLFNYIDIRPQIFTYFLLILFIYIIESYKKKNSKIIYLLPLISIIQINLHAAMYSFLYIFTIPFIIEIIIKKELKKNKLILIIIFISIISGLINPYGIKAITYILYSSDKSINILVPEMHHPSFFTIEYLLFTIIVFINFITYMYYYRKYKNIKISYILLLFESILLFFIAPKSYIFIYIFGIYPISYYLKDVKLSKKKILYLNYIYHIIIIPMIVLLLLTIILLNKNIYLNKDKDIINATKYLKDNYNIKEIKPYNTRNIGPYLEYIGIKPYIDTRAELFIYKMNKKKDISNEYLNIITGKTNIDKFNKKYNFTHLIYYKENDINYYKNKINNYRLIYNKNNIKIWIRKDLYKQ